MHGFMNGDWRSLRKRYDYNIEEKVRNIPTSCLIVPHIILDFQQKLKISYFHSHNAEIIRSVLDLRICQTISD